VAAEPVLAGPSGDRDDHVDGRETQKALLCRPVDEFRGVAAVAFTSRN
jgi:hypothetical protein